MLPNLSLCSRCAPNSCLHPRVFLRGGLVEAQGDTMAETLAYDLLGGQANNRF